MGYDMSSLSSISPVLIANRGEIAARIAWTVRSLGLEAVGVYTEGDASMPHVDSLDRSCRISDYLDGAGLVDAARRLAARAPPR